jgi:hypothetical protein
LDFSRTLTCSTHAVPSVRFHIHEISMFTLAPEA